MLSLLLAGVLAARAAGPAGPVVDRVAAIVGEEIVTLSEVYELGDTYIADAVTTSGEAVRRRAEIEVLDHLIDRRLVTQEVTRLSLDATDQDVDRAIDDTARRNGLDRDQLRAELERQGMAWDQYKSEMKESIREMKFAQNVLRPRVTITEDELRDAWLRSQGGGVESVALQALVLALPADADDATRAGVKAKAEAIAAEARTGKPFDALAREYDQGPYGQNAGEMGRFKRGELVTSLDSAAFATPVGEVALVELANGILVLRVKERGVEATDAGDFESKREELTDAIFETRMEEEKERWAQQARRRTIVKVLLPGGS